MSATLYDFWRSSASYRVRIALNLKGIPYTSVETSLPKGEQRAPGYLNKNPQGFVPMLEIDGLCLTQSLAICDYLDAKVDAMPFVPSDPAARSKVLAMALVIACDIHPINNLRILKYLSHPLDIPEPVRDDWYRHWVIEGFLALEAMASDCGKYLSGETPGLADICLVPQMYNARRFEVDLGPYPTLVRIDAALTALPAIMAAHPDMTKPT
ncbi:MAG: maleylacetoacetate isomerase [Sphingomonadales bacterium]